MKTATIALLLCACASVQAQQVRLEYADQTGLDIAFLGPDQIAIDLVLQFPPGAAPFAGGTVNFTTDDFSLVDFNTDNPVDVHVAKCSDSPGQPCVDGIITLPNASAVVDIEYPGGFNGGELLLLTFRFDSIDIGTVQFSIAEEPGTFVAPGGIPYPLPIAFDGTSVTIMDAQTGASGSLPDLFDNEVGVPENWSTFFLPSLPRGPGPVWRSSAETGACDFGDPIDDDDDNVTGGGGNASCVQNDQPARGPGATAGSFLCTDAPLDTSDAMFPVLEFDANFQPGPGGATFSVISGNTPPPDIANYVTLFETTEALGGFAALPGRTLTVPIPTAVPLYLCIVVEGDYVYSQVDECVSCALSYGKVPDGDGDNISDNVDNCLGKPNPDQRDTNRDGIGNACDADIAPATNDCFVDFLDMQAIKSAFFTQVGEPGYNPHADFNGDGIVNFNDLGLMRLQFLGPPGPSGLLNACNVAERTERAGRAPDCAIPSIN